jgi:hypothetical protein
MARLERLSDGQACLLEPEHLVGRSSLCALQLDAAYVSSQHATFRWTGEHWEIKDLGSRNGTFLNGARLPDRQPSVLRRGALVSFGQANQGWLLATDDPPRSVVFPLDGEPPVVVDGELLALPSADDPQATIFRGSDGIWRLERAEDAVVQIAHQARFEVAGRAFRFSCPTFVSPTAACRQTAEIGELRLIFHVSRDEEHVELRAEGEGVSLEMGSRAHNYVLLTLARHRLADGARGLPETSRGWVYQDDLVRALGTSSPQLNIDIFRIRKQFATLGFTDASAIVERRPRTRQLRIGVRSIEISTL